MQWRNRDPIVALLALVLLVGCFLRLPPHIINAPRAPLHFLSAVHPPPKFAGLGFDEGLYRDYVNALIRGGLASYPDIVDGYIAVQQKLTGSILPPLRFLYIFAAYLWHEIFGTEALLALRDVASFFSMLALALAALFAWRVQGRGAALGVGALMAFAPTQLHMSQHALVDGFFAFWALLNLWLLWENLRAPRAWRWLLPFILSLALMVTTKENAAFAYFAFLVIVIANRWLRWGIVTRELLACLLLGPLLGVVILVFLAGGIETLRTTYVLSVTKNYTLQYAILTGDGPWHRYLIDLLLVSPIVLLLAVARVFRLRREDKAECFVALFVVASYLVMCNVKYGMNLRYANMWDMPIRLLAFSQLAAMTARLGSLRRLVLAGAVGCLSAIEFRQYTVLFVQYPLYELVSEGLLRALQIIKSPPAH